MAKVQFSAVYAADAGFVRDTLTDEAFLAEYAKEIGALNWNITVDRPEDLIRTRLLMHVPTGGIPAIFKRFVPAELEIVETRTWLAATPGRADIAVDAAVAKRDARVRGRAMLSPVVGDTHFEMSGDVSASLPLVGRQAADQLANLIVRVLGNQTTVLNRWIERRD